MNSFTANAYFSVLNPNAFVVQTEELRTGGNILQTANHEKYHLFDCHYKFWLSGGKFEKLFEQELDSERGAAFFDQLNESSFYADMKGHGGHSRDDRRETFASLMNSLTPPKWEKRIKMQESLFRLKRFFCG